MAELCVALWRSFVSREVTTRALALLQACTFLARPSKTLRIGAQHFTLEHNTSHSSTTLYIGTQHFTLEHNTLHWSTTLHIGTQHFTLEHNTLHLMFALLCTSHSWCYFEVQWFSNVGKNETDGLYFVRCFIILQHTYIREHLQDNCSTLNVIITVHFHYTYNTLTIHLHYTYSKITRH
jgi:hypothetical protein